MAGIYIHIPFCKIACHYCNFHFSTQITHRNEFLTALVSEMVLQKNYLSKGSIKTIYLGGGTPSLLNTEELAFIIQNLHVHFEIEENIEFTLEANPDDVTQEKIQMWSKLGINRLSIGIQSFFEEDLLYMNRSHNAAQAKACVKLAKTNGIENISIDLIFGFPNLTNEKWESNLKTAFELNVNHVSCYAMTVEPKTALAHQIESKKSLPIDAEQSATQFEFLMQQMALNGFEHYEISNYAKPKYQAKHNTNYWHGVPYLGLGPSAHSFNGHSRQWNVSNNAIYSKNLTQGKLAFEIEVLSHQQKCNEFIMVSLRLQQGIPMTTAKQKMDEKQWNQWLLKIESFKKRQVIIESEGHIKLTPAGKLFADDIASDLFID